MKHIVICQYCDKEFEGKRSTAAYCSASCRQMAYVKRLDRQYVQRMSEQKATIQTVNVHKPVSQTKLASTKNSNNIVLPSTNNIHTRSYHQVGINNPSIPETIDINSIVEQAEITSTNKKLKRWIEDLLRFDAKRKIYKSDISTLFFQVESFILYDLKKLPKNYPHTLFIIHTMKLKIGELFNYAKQNYQFYYEFQISEDFKLKLLELKEFIK